MSWRHRKELLDEVFNCCGRTNVGLTPCDIRELVTSAVDQVALIEEIQSPDARTRVFGTACTGTAGAARTSGGNGDVEGGHEGRLERAAAAEPFALGAHQDGFLPGQFAGQVTSGNTFAMAVSINNVLVVPMNCYAVRF